MEKVLAFSALQLDFQQNSIPPMISDTAVSFPVKFCRLSCAMSSLIAMFDVVHFSNVHVSCVFP